ncbi:transcriptional regulator [Viridibacillus sp. YIM B01967]|uniref:Transcriptional regulator n=1 Tax=Viridibacillus soli TaxID=2798301 RepID=A0ABS1H7P1_9BACL|nr:transcriptional regulator [Viridibacillus soli]MBK3495336.1 transcriptional regulator [Viridibacillus soli]
MKEQLIKAMQRNQVIDLMYMSKGGEITKRRVKIIKMTAESFQAYCFAKQAKRTFIIDNVLAAVPQIYRENEVV